MRPRHPRPSSKRVIDERHQLEILRMRSRGEQLEDVFDGAPQIEIERFDLQFAGLHLRKVENVIDDGQQGLAGTLDGLGVVALFEREARVE